MATEGPVRRVGSKLKQTISGSWWRNGFQRASNKLRQMLTERPSGTRAEKRPLACSMQTG